MCIHSRCNAIFLVAILAPMAELGYAAEDSTKPVFVLSQEEFVRQRTVMIDDLGKKIELMQQARECAETATTPVAFQACNQAFADGIRAHMAEQAKKK